MALIITMKNILVPCFELKYFLPVLPVGTNLTYKVDMGDSGYAQHKVMTFVHDVPPLSEVKDVTLNPQHYGMSYFLILLFLLDLAILTL